MSTANKLQYLIDAKISISAAIEAKGGDVPQELSGYGPAISALPSGGVDLDKLTYVLYEDNKISGYLLEGSISGESSSMGNAVFQNGKVVQLGNAVTEIGRSALYGVSALTAVTIPNSVTNISVLAFSNCSGLTSVTIPDSVTSIGNRAFENCTSLQSLTIPNSVSSIGTTVGPCNECSSLQNIELPDSITNLPTNSFRKCSSLSSATFGNAVSNIGARAFSNCTNCLTFDFSRATIVPTLANVDAFGTTNANKKIIVPDDLYDSWKAANNWKSTTNGIVDAITKASEA